MSKYQCILFDLDGTLADTFPGILHAYQYAAEKMGLPEPSENLVNEAIGAPLTEVFRKKFGLNQEQTAEAVQYYREQYARTGIMEADRYPHIDEVLRELKARGKLLGVTTLKKEAFAGKILSHLGIDRYMDVILGMDEKDRLTKAELIVKAMTLLGQKREETVLVGDSFYDALGAQEAGVDFIGVTYGFGFQKSADVLAYKRAAAIADILELLEKV